MIHYTFESSKLSWHHYYGRKQRRTKEPLDESEKNEKVGLKLNIQKTKIMAFSPITSWQIDAETMETVSAFTFLGSKITEDEIKRLLLLGRKIKTNLDRILKSRDIYFASKGLSSQSCGFFQ